MIRNIGTTVAATGSLDHTGPIINKFTKLLTTKPQSYSIKAERLSGQPLN